MKYKVGDAVKVSNPYFLSLNWLSWMDSMNKYDGIEAEITGVGEIRGHYIYYLDRCGTWAFAKEWLEPIDHIPGQITIEDFGLVVSP